MSRSIEWLVHKQSSNLRTKFEFRIRTQNFVDFIVSSRYPAESHQPTDLINSKLLIIISFCSSTRIERRNRVKESFDHMSIDTHTHVYSHIQSKRNEAVSITFVLRMKNRCYLHNLLLKKSNCLLEVRVFR